MREKDIASQRCLVRAHKSRVLSHSSPGWERMRPLAVLLRRERKGERKKIKRPLRSLIRWRTYCTGFVRKEILKKVKNTMWLSHNWYHITRIFAVLNLKISFKNFWLNGSELAEIVRKWTIVSWPFSEWTCNALHTWWEWYRLVDFVFVKKILSLSWRLLLPECNWSEMHDSTWFHLWYTGTVCIPRWQVPPTCLIARGLFPERNWSS